MIKLFKDERELEMHLRNRQEELYNGKIGIEELSQLINTEYRIPTIGKHGSLGVALINKFPEIFLKAVDDPGVFIGLHINQKEFMTVIMSQPSILRELFNLNYIALVKEIYQAGQENNGFIKAALEAGSSLNFLAEMVKEKIYAKNPEVAKFFLESGMGRCEIVKYRLAEPVYGFSDQPCHWNLYTQEELPELLIFCARIMPKPALKIKYQIISRLGTRQWYKISSAAAESLTDLDGVGPNIVYCLSPSLMAMTKNIKNPRQQPQTYLACVARVLRSLKDQEQEEYFCQVWPYVKDCKAIMVYRLLWQPRVSLNIKKVLSGFLSDSGYIIGHIQVEEDKFANRQRRIKYFVMGQDEVEKYIFDYKCGQRVYEKMLVIVDVPKATLINVYRDGTEVYIAPMYPVYGQEEE